MSSASVDVITRHDPVVDLGEDGEWFGICDQHVTAEEALPLVRDHLVLIGVLDMYPDLTVLRVEHRTGRWACRHCGSADGEMDDADWRDTSDGTPWTWVSVDG